jgi:2-methylisocitrate lyase-like PEP mutase family enzyme
MTISALAILARADARAAQAREDALVRRAARYFEHDADPFIPSGSRRRGVDLPDSFMLQELAALRRLEIPK